MFKQYKEPNGDVVSNRIISIKDGSCIPFLPDNTDYQQFKKDVLEGAELQDADGDVMTPDAAMIFISNLP